MQFNIKMVMIHVKDYLYTDAKSQGNGDVRTRIKGVYKDSEHKIGGQNISRQQLL